MAQFSWASGADVATGLASAFGSWASTSANSIINHANADAANVIRKAQNEQRASGLSLAATMRSIANEHILTAAGDQANGAAEVIARTHAAWARGDVETGLRHMETLGAFAARSAAAGVGGTSVQAVSYSLRLQQARQDEQIASQHGQLDYEMLKQRTGIMPAATSRMDLSPFTPNFDYSTNQAPAATPGAGLVPSLIEGLLTKKDSLQVALNSIPKTSTTNIGPGLDHMDLADSAYQPITIQ